MNPSSALAAAVVDELVRGGVREAVLSPGSRNAPLAYALDDADRAGLLRLHVRIDERSAGFLALGLAKASGRPVLVTTTSGTAAVNLHPAVVEADHAGVPVIALTADRPVEMRGTGANQTIDQTGLYGVSARYFAELSVDTAPTEAAQRAVVRTAVEAALRTVPHVHATPARGLAGPGRGPVHLNVGLREPLVPELARATADLSGPAPRSMREEPSREPQHVAHAGVPDGRRTLVVAGDQAGQAAYELAAAHGWPLLAEPSSGARMGLVALAAYRLYLDELAEDVERVVVLGRPTLSRPVTRLLARADLEVVRGGTYDWAGDTGGEAGPWARRWFQADAAARSAVEEVLEAAPLSGVAVAAVVAGELTPEALLVAGSSSTIRDLDLARPFDGPAPALVRAARAHSSPAPIVLANRGASGIDGTVSTAVGAALAHQRLDRQGAGTAGPAYALMGDLTFLHDSTGLVIGPEEPRPDLTIVVTNDDGGGLFSLLEQGEPARHEPFERVFGTPHHVDMSALCAATSTPYVEATTLDDLRRELADRTRGVRVVEVPVDRSRTRELHARLKAAALDAIAHLTR